MKYVLNKAWDVFYLPSEYCDLCECGRYDYTEKERTDPTLIKMIEEGCDNPNLMVVEIPENATDWELQEYDGWESVICVVDGKIRRL